MKARHLASLFLLWFTVGWMAMARLEAQQTGLPPEVLHYADTVLYNGKILTADEKFTVVEAVAIRDGKFLAVGPTARILPLAGPNTRRVDLKGKTVTPGIYDMHMDIFGSALINRWTKKFLSGEPQWTTKEEAAEGIKRAVAKAKPGEPVVITRSALGERYYKKDVRGGSTILFEMFTLQELDALSPNNPLFFTFAVNSMIVGENSKAAEVTKKFLPKGVSTPFAKENSPSIVKKGVINEDGILSPGQFAAQDYVFWYEPPDSDAVLPEYRDIQRERNTDGVVLGRGHMGVPLFNGVHALWERGELTIRFRMPFPLTPQISGHATELPPEEAETLIRRWANMSKIGDNMLRVVGMRIPAVGGNVGGGHSWMLEPKVRPYPDLAGNPAPYGGWPEEQEAAAKGLHEVFRAREVLIQACRFGWDTATDHTDGDRAYHEVILAYEECLKDQVVKRPTQRLTTGHTPMSAADDIVRAGKLGVLSNISTGHSIGRDIEAGLMWAGTERVDQWSPVKSFIKAGIHPSLEGTFWELEKGNRSAFYWVSKYITRKDPIYGRVWNAKEALSRQEALWAASIWGAEQLAEGKDLGNIAVGKEADLLVIDKDYMTIPLDDLGEIKPLLTMVGGKAVYEVKGAL